MARNDALGYWAVTGAMIVWVKYGFESTPLKMYNTNVSSAILLSFLKATCIRDIDDVCKQKNIQLSIELDAIRRAMVNRKSMPSSVTPTDTPVDSTTKPPSRPPSGGGVTSGALRPTTPSSISSRSTRRDLNVGAVVENLSEEEAAATAKRIQLEKQLETITIATKLVKDLIAGVYWVDLVDQSGARLNLDGAGNTRANTLLTARQQYAVVAVTKTEYGDTKVTPLVFKLAS